MIADSCFLKVFVNFAEYPGVVLVVVTGDPVFVQGLGVLVEFVLFVALNLPVAWVSIITMRAVLPNPLVIAARGADLGRVVVGGDPVVARPGGIYLFGVLVEPALFVALNLPVAWVSPIILRAVLPVPLVIAVNSLVFQAAAVFPGVVVVARDPTFDACIAVDPAALFLPVAWWLIPHPRAVLIEELVTAIAVLVVIQNVKSHVFVEDD